MSTPFQNRLVGTIIVAAAAIIFLPDILDGEKKTYKDNFESIPSAPKVDFPVIDKKFPNNNLTKLPQEVEADETALDDESTIEEASIDTANILAEKDVTVTAIPKEPSFTSSKADKQEASIASKSNEQITSKISNKVIKEQAWAIQLGSYRHKNNVDELVKKLTKNGYTVFTKPIKTKNGKLTKVFIGPELIKSALDQKLPGLKKLTNVQGKVTRFYPTK